MSVGCTCKQVLPASCQCKKSQSLWCMEDLRASTTWLEHGSPMPKARRGGHSGAPRPGRLGIWCFEKGCTLLFLLFLVALTFMFSKVARSLHVVARHHFPPLLLCARSSTRRSSCPGRRRTRARSASSGGCRGLGQALSVFMVSTTYV